MRTLMLLSTVALLLTSTSLFAAINLQSTSASTPAMFSEGRILINQGQYDEAIKRLESLQKLYPKNSQVFYWLSTASESKGDIKQAIVYTKKGIKISPQNSELRFKLAKLYSKIKKFDDAKKEFEKLEKSAKSAILRKKVKHELSLLKGLRMLRQGKIAQALSYFSDLAQIFPRDVVIKETLANIYLSQNLLDEAERTYLQALTLQPNKASILFSLANLFKRYGDIDYAHTYLKQVIEQDPASTAANNAIKLAIQDAKRAAENNNIEKSISYINTVVNVVPYHKAANTVLADIYRQQKNYDKAVQALKNILIKYPTDKNTRILISDIQNQAGNIDAAIDELQQLITLLPEQNYNIEINTKINILYGKKARSLGKNLGSDQSIAEALKLAQDWYDTGKYDISQWLVEAILKTNPNLHDAHLILGRIYAKRSQFKPALVEFATAIKLDHNTIEARLEYAQVMEILGDYQSAEAIYIDIKPLIKSPVLARRINSAISLVKAEKYRQQGQFTSALRIYEKLEKSNPNDIRTLQHMGNIYLSMGDTDKAEIIFDKLIKSERLLEKQLNLTKQGKTLFNQRSYTKARQKFEKIIALNPKNAQAHYLVGDTYVKEGKIKEARSFIEKSVELDPTNLNLKLKLARLLMIAGDLDRSSRLYETVFRNTNDKVRLKDIK